MFKKITLVIIFYLGFSILNSEPNDKYTDSPLNGKWIKKGDGYYSLVITHIDGNAYSFSLKGLQRAYDPFIKSVIPYYGEMSGDNFIFYLDSNMGLFNDKGRLFDGEDFYEGLEPCSIVFLFNENYVKLATKNCTGWFGGSPVNWGGKYLKSK